MPTIKLLEDVAFACGDLLMQQRHAAGQETEDKAETFGAHFATRADKMSQELGIKMLRQVAPREVIIAEESDGLAPTIPANCTVFDPLDGTTNCYNGSNFFGVTLATFRDEQPVCGVLYYPMDGTIITAERGRGCFINNKRWRLPVWDRPLDKTVIGTDVGPWMTQRSREDLPSILETVTAPLAAQHCLHSLMAGVWGAREVIEGITAGYYNLGIAKIWDAAAGVLALIEAGGVARSWNGQPLQWNRLNMDWVLAANDELLNHVLTYTSRWHGQR